MIKSDRVHGTEVPPLFPECISTVTSLTLRKPLFKADLSSKF